MNFIKYFIIFIIYSLMGWFVEVGDTLFHEKKFVNRGFLIGPYCPIYGIALLLVSWLLKNYISKPVGLFVMSVTLCAIIEYIVSFILEKLFKTRWWDYSHKKFNINGRVCLENLIPFGFGCMLVMYVINPLIYKLVNIIPNNILIIIGIILLIIFIVDICISFKIIWKFKEMAQLVRKDNTEKVTEYVRKEVDEMNKSLYSRLINSFPKLQVIKKKKKKK